MLTETNINNIGVSRFSTHNGDRFSIHSGLELTFPGPSSITKDEVSDISCKNCPIYEYREDTVNTAEGRDRRRNIRCRGMLKGEKVLGPIHIADHVKFPEIENIFDSEVITPCGITTNDFRIALMSPIIDIAGKGVKLGKL